MINENFFLSQVVDRAVKKLRADGFDDLVVVDEDEPLAWVLGEVEDRDLSDEQVVIVLRAEGEFQRSIGAVGSALGDDPVGDE